jgi:hypothetical protein
MLFSEISRLIFEMIQFYYNEASCRHINTGLVLIFNTAGDFARWHPHWHGILLEGDVMMKIKKSLSWCGKVV